MGICGIQRGMKGKARDLQDAAARHRLVESNQKETQDSHQWPGAAGAPSRDSATARVRTTSQRTP